MTPAETSDLELRAYRTEDEDAVIELLQTCLPGWRTPDARERFRWKHERSPFGPSLSGVAVQEGELVAFHAVMRWRLLLDGHELSAGRATDFVVRPDLQRSGIGQRILQRDYSGPQWSEQAVQFTHGNHRSGGKRRKFGFPESTHPVVHLAPLRPLRWSLRRTERLPRQPGGEHIVPAARVLEDAAAVDELVTRSGPRGRLVTDRSVDYLRWRYVDIPGRRYLASALREEDGRLRGLSIGRYVPPPAEGGLDHLEISELIVPEDDPAALRRLLWRSYRLGAAYAATVLPVPVSPRTAITFGFPVARERGWTFNARTVDAGAQDLTGGSEDLSDTRRWVLPFGDLELF